MYRPPPHSNGHPGFPLTTDHEPALSPRPGDPVDGKRHRALRRHPVPLPHRRPAPREPRPPGTDVRGRERGGDVGQTGTTLAVSAAYADATEQARYRLIFTTDDDWIPLIVVSKGDLNPHGWHLCHAQVLM